MKLTIEIPYRNPRLLVPCLHGFCLACLKSHVGSKKTFECPQCQVPVDVPDKGVDFFKEDVEQMPSWAQSLDQVSIQGLFSV